MKVNQHEATSAALGFEDKLWAAADKLRGNMDAAEYKHVVLGLLFLKYISDAFMEQHSRIEEDVANPDSDYFVKEEAARYQVLEDRDEYTADNIFWVPPEARWDYLQARAKQPEIGTLVDDAMAAIERDNKALVPRLRLKRPCGMDVRTACGWAGRHPRPQRCYLRRRVLDRSFFRHRHRVLREAKAWFFYHATNHHLATFQQTAADKATTMGHVKRRHLSEAKTAVPNTALLDEASKIISSLFQRRCAVLEQIRTLEVTRGALLPKLITGEIGELGHQQEQELVE